MRLPERNAEVGAVVLGGGGGGVGRDPGGFEANLIESHEALLSCDDPDSVEEAVVVPHGQAGAQGLQGVQPYC